MSNAAHTADLYELPFLGADPAEPAAKAPAISHTELTLEVGAQMWLRASAYEPASPARAAVVISPALGVPRRFYRRFARWLAAAGYAVIVYDYRGTHDSRPSGSLRGFDATVTQWAQADLPAVIAHQRRQHPLAPLVAIGHSIGGHLLAMLPELPNVDAAITVASGSGWWGHALPSRRLRLMALWYGLLPAVATTLGYVPARPFRFPTDLPAGVALEWSRWNRNRAYLSDRRGRPIAPDLAGRYEGPMLALSFTDDVVSTRRAVEAFHHDFSGARLDDRVVDPGAEGLGTVGHFGFFRPAARPLWRELRGWLEATLP